MKFSQPLQTGTLVQRYKRFLADVIFDDGRKATVHVPNTGSMMSTREPESPVAMSFHDSATRKYPYTLELVGVAGCWVGVNTARPNRIVEEAVREGRIPGLRGYRDVRAEVAYGERSRIDLLLEDGERRCYVEVKNVTYRVENRALFPDAVSERGTRHLHELMNMVKEGHRAVIFFLVNRDDCTSMGPASQIDPLYAKTLALAIENGVEAMAYRVKNTLTESALDRKVKVVLD